MLTPWKESYEWPRADIILPTKVHLIKAIVFAVVMYESESESEVVFDFLQPRGL